MTQQHRYLLSAILWVAAIMLMVFATVDSDLIVAAWAVLVALVAGALTGWLVLIACRDDMVQQLDHAQSKIDRFIGAILGELGNDRPTPIRR